MERSDFSGVILALLTGFFLSTGMVVIVHSVGGFGLPATSLPRPALVAGPAVAPAQVQTRAQAAPAANAATEVKVVATDLKFTPATIQAKVGQPIKVVLEDKGMIEHDLTFPTIKADKPANALKVVAKPGQTVTLEFTPTAKGSYEYVCTIPGHKEAGMKGTINVTD